MKGRKKISEVYKERFQDLEIAPPEDVWEHIAASLPNKKQKTRILPLWYKAAGTAAVLGILFGLFHEPPPINEPFQTSSTPDVPAVSTPEEKNTNNPAPELISGDDAMLTSSSPETPNSNGENQDPMNIPKEPAIKSNPMVGPLEGMDKNPIIKSKFSLDHTFLDAPNLAAVVGRSQEEDQKITDLNTLQHNITKNAYEDEIVEQSSISNRFSVTPTAAAIYFDNIGSGNSLDKQFANKESQGEITMAYGINVAYRISEKVKVRTGFSQIELSHKTQGMSFAAMSNSPAIDDNTEIKTTLAAPPHGSLQQRMNFIEIPMEIEYALIQNKIGVNLIGGISTLFLDGNNVSLNSPFSRTNLGEAKNLNDVSFSANIGIGLDYEVLPQVRLKLEPIFKYQLNTFNNISGFSPYYFGIYSGISYKF